MAKRKAAGRKTKTARRAGAGRSRARKATARKRGGARRGQARRRATAASSRKATRKRAQARKVARKSQARKVARKKGKKKMTARKAPSLNRARRTLGAEEPMVPSPPSSLDLDRSASAARTGRRELHEKFTEHTETSPAMTGGDIDADWESAYSVGDEAPGGDNPTPDQDIVDDIGKAIGVQYEDNEELKGEKKISDRDRRRWELDPASSEDYDER
jgi:hypothetical protein